MTTLTFSSKEELLSQAEKDEACKKGLEWAKEKDSLENVIKEIPLEYRLWCLEKGYSQFIDDCPWEELDGFNWTYLLSSQPQLSKFCSYWEKLNEFNWICLLSKQPKFSEFCFYWEQLNEWHWVYLLSSQPKFSEFCSCWEKIDGIYWTYLLFKQPQLEKFRK